MAVENIFCPDLLVISSSKGRAGVELCRSLGVSGQLMNWLSSRLSLQDGCSCQEVNSGPWQLPATGAQGCTMPGIPACWTSRPWLGKQTTNQPTNNKQHTTNNKHQTTHNTQHTTNNGQHTTRDTQSPTHTPLPEEIRRIRRGTAVNATEHQQQRQQHHHQQQHQHQQ